MNKQLSVSNKKATSSFFKKGLVLSFLLLLTFFVATTPTSIAQSYNFADDSGLSATGNKAGYDSGLTPDPAVIIGGVIQAILGLLGIVFLAFMIYAGITWLTAQGDDQKALKAKKIIEEAIVGLIIVIAAYAITYFIVNYFTTQGIVSQ